MRSHYTSNNDRIGTILVGGLIQLIFSLALPVLTLANHAAPDSLTRGVVLDSVVCEADHDQTYALYLPSGYTSEERWPVVFIFEPGARGRMAADTFRQAGERFGVITLCSNNSSNSSWSGSFAAAEAMFSDAFLRYSVDTSRLFVSGFSGGSRVASSLAVKDPRIKGVIACGAGMYHNRKSHPDIPGSFCYYGIMGRRDMNLPDMVETEARLSAHHIEHHIQYTDITHVWPHAEEITTAVAWLKYKTDSTDHDAREHFLAYEQGEIASMEERGLILDAVIRQESVMDHFPDPALLKHQEALKGSKLYKKQAKQRERTDSSEKRLQKSYLDALTEYVYTTPLRPDTIHTRQWWYNEIDKLKRWENSKKNIESSRLASRLLYLLEVHFDEDIQVYLSKFQWDKALFLADLWERIGPDQLWTMWNLATAFTMTGENERAIEMIEEMVRTGKARYEWFLDAVEFEPLGNEPEYIRLMERLRESENL